MSTSPIIAQLARFEPARGAKPWALYKDDTTRVINSATATDLLSKSYSAEFSSRVTFEYWSRLTINTPHAGASEQFFMEPFAVIDGVTTAFTYPLRYRGGAATDILRLAGWADTISFIHPQNKIVTYGVRARIAGAGVVTMSVSCREYGFRLEWEPIISR